MPSWTKSCVWIQSLLCLLWSCEACCSWKNSTWLTNKLFTIQIELVFSWGPIWQEPCKSIIEKWLHYLLGISYLHLFTLYFANSQNRGGTKWLFWKSQVSLKFRVNSREVQVEYQVKSQPASSHLQVIKCFKSFQQQSNISHTDLVGL